MYFQHHIPELLPFRRFAMQSSLKVFVKVAHTATM